MWILLAALLAQPAPPVSPPQDTTRPHPQARPASRPDSAATRPDSALVQQMLQRALADSTLARVRARELGDTTKPRTRGKPRQVTVRLRVSTPPAGPPDTTRAYLDPGARELVRSARESHAGMDGGIRAYSTLVKQRMGVGLKALRRDRLLVGQDEAARIHWQADGPIRVDMLGARQSVPLILKGFQIPDDIKHPGYLVFEPNDDRLQLLDLDSAFVHAPLAVGSEAHYRFASGDTTTLRLPDGRTLRLIELRVIPRREEPHLLRGSLWIDAASRGVVRGVFRLAAEYDFERDADPEDTADVKDIPGLLKPIKADLRYMTIEYGLVDFHWWLPRLMAVEGSASVGSLASFPFRFERVYSEYSVTGDTAATRVATAPRPPNRWADCRERPGPEGGIDCSDCKHHDCRPIDLRLPADTLALLNSPELPPPPAGAYDDPLITEAQLEDLGRRLAVIPSQPWRMDPPKLHWGLGRAGLVRFNRVEGLSLGARAESDFGPLTADVTGRLGIAPAPADSSQAIRLTPDVVAGVSHEALSGTYRLAGYSRVDVMDPATKALGFGNSFNALFFGRDDGDYFRATGAELTRHAAAGADEHVTWRLFAERQRPLRTNTEWSVRRLFDASPLRPNLAAQPADEAGAEIGLRWFHGVSALRWGGALGLDGAVGTFDYARPTATAQLGFPLPFGLVASTEAAVGTSVGTPPLQRDWFLGGPASLRGYAGDVVHGPAFWRGRAEVATSFPAARLALFGDAGWAGPRDGLRAGRPLYSAGIGASFLDGYIRMDLARALRAPLGWRFDLYLDGIL